MKNSRSGLCKLSWHRLPFCTPSGFMTSASLGRHEATPSSCSSSNLFEVLKDPILATNVAALLPAAKSKFASYVKALQEHQEM